MNLSATVPILVRGISPIYRFDISVGHSTQRRTGPLRTGSECYIDRALFPVSKHRQLDRLFGLGLQRKVACQILKRFHGLPFDFQDNVATDWYALTLKKGCSTLSKSPIRWSTADCPDDEETTWLASYRNPVPYRLPVCTSTTEETVSRYTRA